MTALSLVQEDDLSPYIRLTDYVSTSEPFLFEGLVSRDLTVLAGRAENGKTFLAGHIAAGVITGTGVLGCDFVGEPGRVLIVGADGRWRDEWKERWGAYKWTRDLILFPGDRDELRRLETWKAIAANAARIAVRLVIVDNLGGIAGPGPDLNARGEMLGVIEMIREVTKVAIPVILIHHHGWSGDRSAGSSVINNERRTGLDLGDSRTDGTQLLVIGGNAITARQMLRIALHGADALDLIAVASVGSAPPRASRADRQRQRNSADAREKAEIIAAGGFPCSETKAAKRLHAAGRTTNPNAGRAMVRRLRGTYLTWDERSQTYTAGPVLGGAPGV